MFARALVRGHDDGPPGRWPGGYAGWRCSVHGVIDPSAAHVIEAILSASPRMARQVATLQRARQPKQHT